MFVNWQVMETKQMIYLVTEYASGGEIYGMYFVTVRYCSYLRIEPNWRIIILLFCSLCQFDSRFNWYDFRGVKQLRKDMLMRFLFCRITCCSIHSVYIITVRVSHVQRCLLYLYRLLRTELRTVSYHVRCEFCCGRGFREWSHRW